MKDPTVVVHIPHKLGKAEAVRRLKHGLEKTDSKLPFLKKNARNGRAQTSPLVLVALGKPRPEVP